MVLTVDSGPKNMFRYYWAFRVYMECLGMIFEQVWKNQNFKIFDEFSMVFAILVSDRGFVIE